MSGDCLDMGTCVLDPAEAGRLFRSLQPEGRFQRFVESEGARRAVLGLQAQGLSVVLVTADRQGDNLSSIAKLDRAVDRSRLSHVQRHLEFGGGLTSAPHGLAELELLRAARARRCLVAVPVEKGLPQGGEEVLDLPPHMVKDMQVPYTFVEDGRFQFWLPPPAKRHLVRQQGSSPARASPGGRLLASVGRPAERTRRPASAAAAQQARGLEAAYVPPASARVWEDHLRRFPQDGAATPRRIGPVPLGSGRPLTVESCGCAKPLEFTLGLAPKKAQTTRGLVAGSPSPLRARALRAPEPAA